MMCPITPYESRKDMTGRESERRDHTSDHAFCLIGKRLGKRVKDCKQEGPTLVVSAIANTTTFILKEKSKFAGIYRKNNVFK